eukprot:330446-Pleurochrysis_carterae.AAC.2
MVVVLLLLSSDVEETPQSAIGIQTGAKAAEGLSCRALIWLRVVWPRFTRRSEPIDSSRAPRKPRQRARDEGELGRGVVLAAELVWAVHVDVSPAQRLGQIEARRRDISVHVCRTRQRRLVNTSRWLALECTKCDESGHRR